MEWAPLREVEDPCLLAGLGHPGTVQGLLCSEEGRVMDALSLAQSC